MTLSIGTQVHTLEDKGADDWLSSSRENCQWNVDGEVVGRATGHGLCYKVLHKNKETAWYNPDELELAEGERILVRGW